MTFPVAGSLGLWQKYLPFRQWYGALDRLRVIKGWGQQVWGEVGTF